MKRITYEMLKGWGANCDGLERFREVFPNNADLTEENLTLAAREHLDLGWFAQHFLPMPLLAEYERQQAPLWAEYERQKAPLLAEYERQEAPLLAGYRRQKAPLLAEYRRQQAPLLAGYRRQQALLIWRLLVEGGLT